MTTPSFVAGDTGSKILVTCTDDATGAAINLTGATIKLRWKNQAGTVVERAMVITNAAAGKVEYQFTAVDLEAGPLLFDVQVTDSAGKILTNVEPIDEMVRGKVA